MRMTCSEMAMLHGNGGLPTKEKTSSHVLAQFLPWSMLGGSKNGSIGLGRCKCGQPPAAVSAEPLFVSQPDTGATAAAAWGISVYSCSKAKADTLSPARFMTSSQGARVLAAVGSNSSWPTYNERAIRI